MINDYAYWEKALADPRSLQARDFRITEEPQAGFYRTRKLEPVAIWYEDDQPWAIVVVGDVEVDMHKGSDIWLSVAKHPVTEDAYRKAKDGKGWADIDTFLASIGDNRFRSDDAVAIIDDLARQADSYKEITSEAEAQRAMSLRNALLEKRREVEAKREELKAPHLKAARDVDLAWMPPVKQAEKAANYLKAIVESFRTALLRKQREAEAAARLKAAPPPVPPSDQIRSGHGRAVSVKPKLFVVVTDLLAACAALQDEPELMALVEKLAQKRLDADGEVISGVIAEERAVVR